MSDEQPGQINITAGNIIATGGSLVAIGTNITQSVTFIFNGREYQRPFVNVPARPAIFVGREELLGKIKATLFKGGSLAVSAFEGKPGVGKTALATALAWDEEVLAHFSGGTLWANLGPNPDLDTILNRWAEALGVDATKETDTAGRIAAVQIGLNGRTPLIILDDVWDKRPAHQLRKVGNPGTAYLLTTRDTAIARDFAPKSRFDVVELTEEQAIELLIEFCPAAAADRPALERIARAVGYLPLALTLIGGYMADHVTLPAEAATVLPDVARAERWLGLEDIDRTLTLEQVIARSVDARPDVARAERWLGLEDIDRTLTLEQVIARSVDALPETDPPPSPLLPPSGPSPPASSSLPPRRYATAPPPPSACSSAATCSSKSATSASPSTRPSPPSPPAAPPTLTKHAPATPATTLS